MIYQNYNSIISIKKVDEKMTNKIKEIQWLTEISQWRYVKLDDNLINLIL